MSHSGQSFFLRVIDPEILDFALSKNYLVLGVRAPSSYDAQVPNASWGRPLGLKIVYRIQNPSGLLRVDGTLNPALVVAPSAKESPALYRHPFQCSRLFHSYLSSGIR